MILWECPIELVPTYWPKARSAIERALQRQRMGQIERAERAVLAGEMQLWLAYDAPAAGYIGAGLAYISDGIMNVCAWEGTLAQLELVPAMIAAMTGRAEYIRFIGPEAWGRVLPGWKKIAAVFELKLESLSSK